MMGVQAAAPRLFYDFCLDDHVPADHQLRGIDRHLDLDDVRNGLKPFYSSTGRPSIDPELMIRRYVWRKPQSIEVVCTSRRGRSYKGC